MNNPVLYRLFNPSSASPFPLSQPWRVRSISKKFPSSFARTKAKASIKDEVSRRKLMHPLTPQEEATLKSQGASDSLVSSLRNSNLVASKEEARAVEAARNRERSLSPTQCRINTGRAFTSLTSPLAIRLISANGAGSIMRSRFIPIASRAKITSSPRLSIPSPLAPK